MADTLTWFIKYSILDLRQRNMKRQKTFWLKCANRTTARRAAMTKGTPIDRHVLFIFHG